MSEFELLPDRMTIADSAWIAPNAVVLGQVEIGERSSVWFGCVLRGDLAPISIGQDTNLQDGCILHVNKNQPCILGDRVSLGHGAIVHAATLEDEVLVAMRATVLSGARVGKGSLIGAGAVVAEGAIIPPNSLVLGIPGKVIKEVSAEQRQGILRTSEAYAAYARQYKERFKA